jgi:hypothetical protein
MLSLTSDAMQTCYADYRTDYYIDDIQLQPCTESSLISPQTRALTVTVILHALFLLNLPLRFVTLSCDPRKQKADSFSYK